MNTKNEGRPIKKAGYSHAKADARRDAKRQQAEARQRAHEALTVEEKLAKCEARAGYSRQERRRLTATRVSLTKK